MEVVRLIRPLGERTKLLTVLLWLITGVSAAWLLAIPFIYMELAAGKPQTPIDAAGGPVLLAAGVVAWLLLPLSILVGVVFLMWVYRATANLRTLTSYEMRFTPGWSVGWYLVPVLFLVKPYQGMVDIWRASHGGSRQGESLVRVWWALFLLSLLAARALGASAPEGETAGAYMKVLLYEAPGYALEVALYAVMLRMVTAVGAAYSESVSEWALEHPQIPEGWYPDPGAEHKERFWEGSQWGDAVRDTIDSPIPVQLDAAQPGVGDRPSSG
jgi:hypothetical protein